MVQLFELLGKRKLVLLWKFLLQKQGEISQKEVLKETGISKATLISDLRLLEKHQLITSFMRGTAKYYRQTANPLNNIMKTASTVGLLLPLADIGAEICLFGSAARGEDRLDSDIDILVIGKVQKQELAKHIMSLHLEKTIKPVVLTPMEWAEMKTKDPAFYERVETDKVRITWT